MSSLPPGPDFQQTTQILLESQEMDRALEQCPQCRETIDVSLLLPLTESACPRCAAIFIARVMERACHLLGSRDIPIKEIAAQVGYSDPFYFSKGLWFISQNDS